MAPASKEEYVFVLVGATGAVGREMLSILGASDFPVKELRPVASERSKGSSVPFRGEETDVLSLTPDIFKGADIAFFTAGGAISREFVSHALEAGCLVVDNTSTFRMDADVPLAVPEVNPEVLRAMPKRRLFSVPNCATVQIVVALAPLHRKARIKRIVASTYQSTSGAGKRAMEELSRQVADLFNYREAVPEVLPHRIAFNLIPQIDSFLPDGMTKEEAKIIAETKKILGDETIGVSATAVRVATFHGHAVSMNVEFEKPISAEDARKILSDSPGIAVVDEPKEQEYPTPADVAGQDEVFVGRIRNDPSRPNCLNLWVVADNLRKGAALNGFQIIQALRSNHLL